MLLIQAPTWQRALEIGKEHNGLYLLSQAQLYQHQHQSFPQNISCVSTTSKALLWHNRLGHVPSSVLKLIHVSGLHDVLPPCDACMLSKQTRQKFAAILSVSKEIFDLVHIDLWGPYRHKTHNNCTMFLTIVDDKSRSSWVYLLSDKSTISSTFKAFMLYVENQFSTTIKTVRSDNDSEFLNHSLSSWFVDKGDVHQTTCVYTPQHNGLVERKHRILLNIARSLRFHSCVPLSFWGDCLLTTVYILNRTPSLLLNGLTPYEMLFQTPPDFHKLKVFGCLCYAIVVPHPTDKFAPCAIKGVFVGYPFATKGYRVLDLQTKKVLVCRDVHFFETIFSFQSMPTQSISQLFPHTPNFVDCDPLYIVTNVPHSGSDSPVVSTAVDDLPTVVSSDIPSNISTGVAPLVLDRPHRTRQLPSKFSDYAGLPTHLFSAIQLKSYTTTSCSSLMGYMSDLPFDPSIVPFVASVNNITEPTSYKQAIKQFVWCEAMSVELAALEVNNTWELKPLPNGKKIVECRWLYKIKYLPNGTVDRYKARLVVKGFTQTEGLDYFKTFAHVAKMSTLRILLTLAAKHNWCIKQLDVTNAFLHDFLDEEVYMDLSPGYIPPSAVQSRFTNQRLVCRLINSIYGLKQAPRQ